MPREADPNNLAPTASTTAQMVMGDVVAVTLLAMRGFTSADFARFHPGGTLGKQLYLRVSDIFPNNELPKVLPSTGLRDIILEMTSKRLGAAVVADKHNQVIGIVTDGDLRRMLQKNSHLHSLTAADIMTLNPKTVDRDELAAKALFLMRQHSITQLVVTGQNKEYLGIVHLHDLIREGVV